MSGVTISYRRKSSVTSSFPCRRGVARLPWRPSATAARPCGVARRSTGWCRSSGPPRSAIHGWTRQPCPRSPVLSPRNSVSSAKSSCESAPSSAVGSRGTVAGTVVELRAGDDAGVLMLAANARHPALRCMAAANGPDMGARRCRPGDTSRCVTQAPAATHSERSSAHVSARDRSGNGRNVGSERAAARDGNAGSSFSTRRPTSAAPCQHCREMRRTELRSWQFAPPVSVRWTGRGVAFLLAFEVAWALDFY